jgi:DNA-binding PadR family transcriptional regulator
MFFGKRFRGYQTDTLSGLDILVLNIIKNHSGITGYEITQVINRKFGGLWRGSAGTIYPLLNKLAEVGFVKISEIMEGNRLKKKYGITKKGETELKNVLTDNIFPSMHSLMDYIFTIVDDFPGIKRNVETMFCSFPYHRSVDHPQINEDDLSLQNQHLIENSIKKLAHSKHELTKRIKMIEKRISKFKTVLQVIKKERVEKAKNIEILDDDIYL